MFEEDHLNFYMASYSKARVFFRFPIDLLEQEDLGRPFGQRGYIDRDYLFYESSNWI